MIVNFDVKGLEETKKMLKKVAEQIDVTSKDVLSEIGQLGWEYATNLVPKERGYTAEGIINFPQDKETWIILSQPPADHPDFPLNVRLDEGNGLNWGSRGTPKTGEFGFMQKTADFLEEEFSKRLKLEVSKI